MTFLVCLATYAGGIILLSRQTFGVWPWQAELPEGVEPMSIDDEVRAVAQELGRGVKLAYYRVREGWILLGRDGKVASVMRREAGSWMWKPEVGAVSVPRSDGRRRTYGETVREVCHWFRQ
jgi:hypothetical protein